MDFHESILRVSRETFLKKVTFETQKRSKIVLMQWSVFFLSKSEKKRGKSLASRILGRRETRRIRNSLQHPRAPHTVTLETNANQTTLTIGQRTNQKTISLLSNTWQTSIINQDITVGKANGQYSHFQGCLSTMQIAGNENLLETALRLNRYLD